MTRYYIDLKDYAETADIKTVGDDTLREVIKDFTKELQERALNIDDVSNCVKNCTDFNNIESLLFDFWTTLKNDVDCINSENIIGKINNFCKTLK